MLLRTHRFELPLRHTFTISRESYSVQETLIVELEQDGLRGYGEATTNKYYGVTYERMAANLEAVRAKLADRVLEDPVALWEELAPSLAKDRFAQCALDQAAHDLWGKLKGQPVFELWGLNTEQTPPTDYTIGIDRIDVMAKKLREFPDWPVYKIKLGTPHDLEIIQQLRQLTPAVFRVDANCGWTADEAIRNSQELGPLNVEFIEQPLPAERWDEMKRVYSQSHLPIMADESCQVEADVARCAGHFHGVNIKLVKCGGLTPARRMIAEARAAGLKVMVGCMTESSVGISSIAQLLPLLDYVDMDGALLLERDIARGVTIEQGYCRYPDRPGCGVELIDDV